MCAESRKSEGKPEKTFTGYEDTQDLRAFIREHPRSLSIWIAGSACSEQIDVCIRGA
jgi:hypothetical protein